MKELGNSLEDHFKNMIGSMKHFSFSNFGTLIAFLAILIVASIIFGLIWMRIITMVTGDFWSFDYGDWEDYYHFWEQSKLTQSFGIVGVGLFAALIQQVQVGDRINLGGLFTDLNPQLLRNFFILVGILAVASLFVERDEYFRYNPYFFHWSDAEYVEDTARLKFSVMAMIELVYYVLAFYFAALIAQIGSGSFSLAPSGKMGKVLAGTILLMAFSVVLDSTLNTLLFHLVYFFTALMGSAKMIGMLAYLIMIFVATIALLPKARSLGKNDDESIIMTEFMDDGDFLDE